MYYIHRSTRVLTRILLSCVLLLTTAIVLAAVQPSTLNKPERARLAENKQVLLPIVVGEKATDRIKQAAATLADYLQRMTGAPFTVEVGDGSRGIVVGMPGDFSKLPMQFDFEQGPYHREDFRLYSQKNGLWLIGTTELAVEHAVWDLLQRIGYRQYFPGKKWEVIPTLSAPSIAIDALESPDYYHRRIWYNWGAQDYNIQSYRDWNARNRMAQGFLLNSGHAYGNMIGQNKAEFDAHPEYYALIGGKRVVNGESKMCISNPGLRKVLVDWAVRTIKANPNVDSISAEPSDGGGWCECDECAKMGSPSNRALTLANDIAEAINGLGLGDKYVGMYAYNFHCPPPTIRVHPKVIVTATTAFITGGYTLDQVIDGWQKQGATMGIYDYYSVSVWDWNMPGRPKASHPDAVANDIRRFYNKQARFYDCESGDCWGPSGLGYYVASRVMWDINQADRVKELTEDFLTNAFGPAKEPMRGFYTLITGDTSHRSGSDMTGRMYRFLDEARKLAAGRPDVMARLDDLLLYTRYAELNYIMSGPKADAEARNRWLAFTYRIRKTEMVHYYGLWSDGSIGQTAANDLKHPLKDDTPFTQEDLATFLKDGIANNQPVERGFEPVEFSKNLVPVKTKLQLPDVPTGSVPTNPQSSHTYYIWIDKAPAEISLKVTVQRVWDLRQHHVKLISLKDPAQEKVVTDDTSVKPDGQTYDVVLRTPDPGLHRVEAVDGGDYTRIVWPEELAVSIPSAIDTPGLTSMFYGAWNLYCYVPKGTTVVGGWASRIATWAPRLAGVLRDADGNALLDFGAREDGWFSVPVPKGQDGRLWKFENSQGVRQLMTVPPYLFWNNNTLLPKEVVEKDAR